MSVARLVSCCLAAVWILSTASVQASEKVVWQIGQFDNNYAELAVSGDTGKYRAAFPQGVIFRVGQDDPAKAWPFIHPGPNDVGWAGEGTHPYTILFDLPEQPRGAFTLTIDFLSTHRFGPPAYEVMVNGIKGMIGLPSGPGDAPLGDPSQGREHVLSIPLSPAVLKQGQNTIRLTGTSGSWAIYDAISLTNDPDGNPPPIKISDLKVESTSRVIRQDGRMKRILKVSARLSRGLTPASAVVKIGASEQRVSFESDIPGAAWAEAVIDDTGGPVHVEAAMTCEGVTSTGAWGIKPQRHWKLYIQPASHLDIGYTDYQERIAQVHNDNVSRALDIMRRYPEFKWNTEGAWVEDNYLSMMGDGRHGGTATTSSVAGSGRASVPAMERRDEFIVRAKEGRIGCPALYGSMLTGICSHEGLIRTLYYAHGAARKYGIPFDMAMSCDVPTHVWTMPTILTGSGIRYFSAALNYGRDDISKRPMNRPFWWEGPDGSRVLTWFAPLYGWAWRLGLTESLDAAGLKVDDFLCQFDRDDYACDAVLAYGAVEDNRSFGDLLASVIDEWNKRYVSPKIILCRGPEFFEYVEQNWKGEIPVLSGDAGVCWEDGAASTAMETAKDRRAETTLLTAEKLNSLTAVLGKPAVPKPNLDAAWKNAILWDEHTWGAACSFDAPQSDQTLHQWEVKASFANELARQSDAALRKGIDALAGLVGASEPSIIVYNPLSWTTSGLVQAKTSDGRTVEFRAKDVPALGYKVFPMPAPIPNTKYETRNTRLENRFYRIELDPVTGAVKSLYDKDLRRELVDPGAGYGLNQYIYLAKTADNFSKEVTRDSSTPPVRVSVEDRPGGKALIISGSAYNTPEWTSEIVLRDDEKRIDFINTIDKKETMEKEWGYYAFPFRLDQPRFHVELPNGVLRPDTQTLPGACMEWYCLQDFVAVEDGDCAVTWTAVDSPLITFAPIITFRYNPHSQRTIENGTFYAHIFNNAWETNYKASQGGKMTFRFSMTSSRRYDPVRSAQFGQSVRNPLIAAVVDGGKSAGVHSAFSFCTVSPANVEVQSVKQAESVEGFVIRLRELSGRATTATVSLPPGTFRKASLCNLMEDPQSDLAITGDKLTVKLPANGLATVRLISR